MHMSNQNQALQKNQILQASHRLLSMFERSKENIESVIDTMPNLYGVIQKDGTLIKANKALAALFPGDYDQEDLVQRSIESLFPKTSWNVLQARINHISGPEDSESLEIAINLPNSDHFGIFNLHIRSLDNERKAEVYEIFAVDVTAVRSFESQLTQIFKSIPLGIFRVNKKFKILSPYSTYTEFMLGRKDLDGQDALDVLFQEDHVVWTEELRKQVKYLGEVFSFSPLQFDDIKTKLPKVFQVKAHKNYEESTGSKHQWLGLSFDTIVENGSITGLLLVVEDRTAIEAERTQRTQRSSASNL